MAAYERVKSRIIELVEILYGLDSTKYAAQRAALGDVGYGPNWETIVISDLEFLVGSVWNPKTLGANAEDGPDIDQIDKGTIPLLLQGIMDSLGVQIKLSEPVSKYNVLAYTSTGDAQLANAAGNAREKNPIGVALEDGTTNVIRVHTIGSLVRVKFTGIPIPTEEGKEVYLSTTNGKATMSAPAASGNRVMRLGIMSKTDGTNTPLVLWQPSFVQDIP